MEKVLRPHLFHKVLVRHYLVLKMLTAAQKSFSAVVEPFQDVLSIQPICDIMFGQGIEQAGKKHLGPQRSNTVHGLFDRHACKRLNSIRNRALATGWHTSIH